MQDSIAVIDIMNRNLRMPQCDFVHQIRNIAAFGRRLFQKFSARRHVVKKIPHRNGSALPAGGILHLLYLSGMNHNARACFLVSGFRQHFHLRHRRDTRQCFAAKAQCKNMLQILNLRHFACSMAQKGFLHQAEVTVSRYDLFQDPGATARDRCDGDLTASIQVTDKASGDVHTLTYTVTDKAGNAATATRRVTVRDIVTPVITLSGQRELFVPLGGAYQEPGYTAQDDADGDLTASVTRAGTVNTASPGVYTLTYTVTDKAGNTATATRQVSVYENSSGGSPVYLTFDDGPSDRVTPRVLDTLKEYNVHATFFIVNYGESGKALIRRMIDEGHTVAIHGYSHDYAAIYKSDEAFMQNIYRLRDRLRSDFGYEAAIIRFPGGSSNTVSRQYSVGIMSRLAQRVQAEGFTYFDWNVSSGDAAGTPASSGQIYNNVTSALRHGRSNVVLMHDAGAKGTTADALPDIIRYCLANGYSIQPITPATKPVHHGIAN